MIAMILSLIILILSDSRPLVEVEINGRPAVMLIDTGSSTGLIDINQMDEYGFSLMAKTDMEISSIGGKRCESYRVRDLWVRLEGIALYQFLATDISLIAESIHKETGYRISGIIGYDQIKNAEIKIDASDNLITIGD
jgi:hypothetical protein